MNKDRNSRRAKRPRSQKLLAGYMALLLCFTTYVALDTFVITRVYGEEVASTQSDGQNLISQDGSSGDALADQPESGSDSSFGDSNSDSSAEGNQDMGPGRKGPGSGRGSGHGSGHGKGQGHGPGGRSEGRGSSATADQSGNNNSNSGNNSNSNNNNSSNGSSALGDSSQKTQDTYKDENISVELKEYRENDTTIYVADVELASPEYLKTAFAQGAYGRNVTAKTSETAANAGAVLAINGDYYGARQRGYVIRNGTLYRSTSAGDQEDLVIYKDGSVKIINENDVTAEELIKAGAVQTLSFGPALVQNGSITVSAGDEVGKAMASNPRTAIGIIDDCHYVFVVSDGRTSESSGLSLSQLAEFMKGLGVSTAYNLDGGGSSTMYFNGQVVNNPTTGGNNIKERSVSDIVYIG